MRVRVLPSREPESPLPFETLLRALSGGLNTVEILISSTRGELEFRIGSNAQTLEECRRLLAPGLLMEKVPSAGTLPRDGFGAVFRVKAEISTRDPRDKGRVSLLDKLAVLEDGWALLLRFEAVQPEDILPIRFQLTTLEDEAASSTQISYAVTQTVSKVKISHRWSKVTKWLAVLEGLLDEGEGEGLWAVETWLLANDRKRRSGAFTALSSSIRSREGRWYSTREVEINSAGVSPTSILPTADLASLLETPLRSFNGLEVRPAPPDSRRPAVGGDALVLGTFLGTSATASIHISDLEGHGFITGTTGSGKTTTLHTILVSLWNEHRIPFLIVDPVKDDYSNISDLFDGGIQVFHGANIRFDLLSPWFGEERRRHITQIADAFRGAFTMPSPTPYVVTRLFDQLSLMPGEGRGATLFDARDMVPKLVASLGYAPEQEANISAVLMTRLDLLLSPVRAHRFVWPDTALIADLFDRPTVVTLSDLGDEEERSFLVILLAIAAAERARSQSVGRDGPKRSVDHVLVLEEAHRVLPEVGMGLADPESGSAKRVATELLSSMLSEVRSYGEQIIVVDQSPSRVSSEVIRNTNLKIVHRVVHPDDQEIMAGALGLDTAKRSVLGSLGRGTAVLTTRMEPSAQTIAVRRAFPTRKRSTVFPAEVVSPWPCSCKSRQHFDAWGRAHRAASPMAEFLASLMWGEGDGREARARIRSRLVAIAEGNQQLVNCLAWSGLRTLLSDRRRLGHATGPHSADAMLTQLFDAWASGRPLTAFEFEDEIIFPTSRVRADGARGLSWEERAIARSLLSEEPRDGFAALRTDWRRGIGDVIGRLNEIRRDFDPVLGEGTPRLLRVLVFVAVEQMKLSDSVAHEILDRSGL
ncbi:ATP-binding protein [Schaalia cardiffensis]|uniref:ATP-binding protein n=1 Tax=Schaalia cardiffensis TaxID=181487 RepID=UPI0018E7947E|nr:DUF87 domain-containing protein [Schaalia cardiffensis]MBJ2329771.1 ATP-binding protein [Schaalia cardiffensis]